MPRESFLIDKAAPQPQPPPHVTGPTTFPHRQSCVRASSRCPTQCRWLASSWGSCAAATRREPASGQLGCVFIPSRVLGLYTLWEDHFSGEEMVLTFCWAIHSGGELLRLGETNFVFGEAKRIPVQHEIWGWPFGMQATSFQESLAQSAGIDPTEA